MGGGGPPTHGPHTLRRLWPVLLRQLELLLSLRVEAWLGFGNKQGTETEQELPASEAKGGSDAERRLVVNQS